MFRDHISFNIAIYNMERYRKNAFIYFKKRHFNFFSLKLDLIGTNFKILYFILTCYLWISIITFIYTNKIYCW